MAAHLSSMQKVHWDAESTAESGSEFRNSSKAHSSSANPHGDNNNNPTASLTLTQGSCFENGTFSDSDTDEAPRTFPAVDSLVKISKLLPRTKTENKTTKKNSTSLKWLIGSAMDTSESDVESNYSHNSGLGTEEEEKQENDNHAMESSDKQDDEFLDLNSEKDLQAKQTCFMDHFNYIQAILDDASVSDNAHFDKDIWRRIQIHMHEIAVISSRDVQKIQEEVPDSTSTNLSQEGQLENAKVVCPKIRGCLNHINKASTCQNKQLQETSPKKTFLGANLETSSKSYATLNTKRSITRKPVAEGLAKGRTLESVSKTTMEDLVYQNEGLRCNIQVLEKHIYTMEEQHRWDLGLARDRASFDMQETCAEKDIKIAALDAEVNTTTRLAICQRAQANEMISGCEERAEKEKNALLSQIQELQDALQCRNADHAAAQRKLESSHSIETTNHSLAKLNSLLEKQVHDIETFKKVLETDIQFRQSTELQNEEKSMELCAENREPRQQIMTPELQATSSVQSTSSHLSSEIASLQLKVEELETAYESCDRQGRARLDELIAAKEEILWLNHSLDNSTDHVEYLETKLQELEPETQSIETAFHSDDVIIGIDPHNATAPPPSPTHAVLTLSDELTIASLRETLRDRDAHIASLEQAALDTADKHNVVVAQLMMQRTSISSRAKCLADALEEEKQVACRNRRAAMALQMALDNARDENAQLWEQNGELGRELARASVELG